MTTDSRARSFTGVERLWAFRGLGFKGVLAVSGFEASAFVGPGLYVSRICLDATQIHVPACILFLQPTKLAFTAITVIFPLTLIPS